MGEPFDFFWGGGGGGEVGLEDFLVANFFFPYRPIRQNFFSGQKTEQKNVLGRSSPAGFFFTFTPITCGTALK